MPIPPIVLVLSLQGCIIKNLFPEKSETESFTIEAEVEGVQFELPAGSAVFTVADVDRIEVKRTIHYKGDPPSTSEQVAEDTLFLKAECEDLNNTCSVDVEVTMPAALWVAGETGAGDVTVAGESGSVDLVTGAGDISVDGAIGTVVLDTGAGDIFGGALDSYDVLAETDSGSVDLEVIGTVAAIYVDSGAGDIDLVMPAGVYAAQVASGAGQVTIEGITADSTATATLYVHTGAGDIRITGF